MGTLVERTSPLLILIKLPHPKPASAANVLQAFTDKLNGIAPPMRQSLPTTRSMVARARDSGYDHRWSVTGSCS